VFKMLIPFSLSSQWRRVWYNKRCRTH